MQADVKEVGTELNELVRKLRRESERFQDIRISGPRTLKDGFLWTVLAELKGSTLTQAASVEYHPDKGTFEGTCNGEYSLEKLSDVKSRIAKKYL